MPLKTNSLLNWVLIFNMLCRRALNCPLVHLHSYGPDIACMSGFFFNSHLEDNKKYIFYLIWAWGKSSPVKRRVAKGWLCLEHTSIEKIPPSPCTSGSSLPPPQPTSYQRPWSIRVRLRPQTFAPRPNGTCVQAAIGPFLSSPFNICVVRLALSQP